MRFFINWDISVNSQALLYCGPQMEFNCKVLYIEVTVQFNGLTPIGLFHSR